MGIGNTIMGTVENNVLWSLALILLLMSLLFNIVIRIIGKRGALKIMNAKKADKIATGILYAVSGVIVFNFWRPY